MTRILFLSFMALCLASVPVLAGEPVMGQGQAIGDTGWSWEISEDAPETIALSSAGGANADYDISECMFCTGDEDNCGEDGIFTVRLPENEPAVAVVCHKGAHSQRLQVFAPLRDAENPVFVVTGDYWVNFEPSETGLSVTYDQRKADGVIATLLAKWPR